ncbi:MAG: excinuclease ABC subunit UvrC, partial [Verrucomicrobia bacterium]|nr:excinuclease ABC subunit UvrC [Verrucomicrobiota bacterium]
MDGFFTLSPREERVGESRREGNSRSDRLLSPTLLNPRCARAGVEEKNLCDRPGLRETFLVPTTDQIRDKLSQLPHKSGVYLMKDRFGTVIYVGKARDLRKRVSQYFHPSRRHGWDLKLNALIEAVHDFDVHVVRNEPEAVLLEGKLIKEFHPRYNVSFRDDKRFLLLKVNVNDPIPRFTLTRLKQEDGARYFGPFASSGALRRTLTMIRRKFNLRGCRPLTPTAQDYTHCLYANLKYCTAPCIGNVTREQYLLQVQAACEFLDGQSHEMEAELESEMKKASAALDFEQAAQLRDMLQDVRRTTKKTNKFARLPYKLPVALDPERDLTELTRELKLPAPPHRIEGFDISNISGTFAVASMVSFKQGRADRANYRRFKMKTVTGQDDFACMAETIRRRYSRLLRESGGNVTENRRIGASRRENEANAGPTPRHPDTPTPRFDPATTSSVETQDRAVAPRLPDLILIDGGKGQLNAACAELAKLGLSHIPIIGLAKEFEEIYRPGESEPLRLSHDSGALKLLQRVRDESHRFANTYNAQLRLKKISESIL